MKTLFKKFIYSDTQLIIYYQFVRFGSNIFIAIILSQFFFDIKKISEYETILLSVSTFVFFWNTGFTRFFQSTYSQLPLELLPEHIHRMINSSIVIGLITSLLFCFIYFHQSSIFLWIALRIFTSIIANPLEYYAIAMKRQLSVFMIINLYFGTFIIWTIYCYYYGNFIYMVIGWIVLDLFKLATFLYWNSYQPKFLDCKNFINLIFLSISALLSGGVEYINFWMVKNYYTELDFVIYRYGARELPFSALIAFGLSATLTAQINAQQLSSQQVKTKITQLLHTTFPISIFLILVSDLLFEWIYGSHLSRAAKVFDIFLLLNISRVMLLDIYLLANQKHRFFLFTALLELITVMTIGFLGIYWNWKVENIAFSIFFAYLIERMALILKLQHLSIPITNFFPIKPWLMYSFILIGIFLVKKWMEGN